MIFRRLLPEESSQKRVPGRSTSHRRAFLAIAIGWDERYQSTPCRHSDTFKRVQKVQLIGPVNFKVRRWFALVSFTRAPVTTRWLRTLPSESLGLWLSHGVADELFDCSRCVTTRLYAENACLPVTAHTFTEQTFHLAKERRSICVHEIAFS